MRDITMSSMKNKSIHSCRFVQPANFQCIMTNVNSEAALRIHKQKYDWMSKTLSLQNFLSDTRQLWRISRTTQLEKK